MCVTSQDLISFHAASDRFAVQVHEHDYKLMFHVSLDILPIQASSVPCERVFSSAKETFPLRRSNLSAELFEALQILKFSIKQQRLTFTDDWIAKEEEYSIEDDSDVVEQTVRELLGNGKVHELAAYLSNRHNATV